jgi:hypothetical protein
MAASAVSSFASVDTSLIGLIPSTATLVAGIDVAQCRNSQFGQYVLSKSEANDPHLDQFMTQTGFDPRRDLDNVVVASTADSTRTPSFAILARGNFDANKIASLATSKGAVATTFQGVNLLVSKDHGQQVALAFPDAGLAVMGDIASVHQVIQNMSNPTTLDMDLSNRINSVGAANDAWFVSTKGASMIGNELSAQTGTQTNTQMQALRSIRAASGGVKFGSNVAVTFDAGTRSAQDATSLADVFRFGASMVQMQRDKSPQAGLMAASMDNMQLTTNGDTVHVAFSMSEKNLEQMAELRPTVRH